MKTETLFLILLAFSVHALGQTPGHLGKRIAMYYDSSPTLDFIRQYGSFKDPEQGVTLNVHHEASLGYSLSSSIEIGLATGFFRSGLNDSGDKSLVLQSQIFSIFLKRFRSNRGWLAPMGRYIRYEIGFIRNRVGDRESSSTVNHLGTNLIPLVSLTLGRQYIVADRLLINLGAQMGFPLRWISIAESTETTIDGYETAGLRMFSHYALIFKLGIGLLTL